MKTFKEHLEEDGEVPANAIGNDDKTSVAGQPIRKKGIQLIKRDNKPQPKSTVAP